MNRRFLIVSFLALIMGFAQIAPVSAANFSSNPVLAKLAASGAKLFSLGPRSGLEGWLVIKDGQVQIAYATADNQSVLLGVMFDQNGDSYTAQQMKTLVESDPEAKVALQNLGGAQQTSASTAISSSPAPSSPVAAAPTLSPGLRLMQALDNAAGVDVGSATAPKLYAIVDPNCLHCQATWKALRDSVFAGKLRIRLVPIGTFGTDNERAAAVFLHVPQPAVTWDKYVAGDKSVLAGTPDEAALINVRANHALIDSWHVQSTPYLLYRGKDGQAKLIEGEPQAAVLLGDIGS